MSSSLNNPSTSSENNPSHPDSFYRELFNLTPVIKLIIDPVTLQIVEANPAACQFYGYSQEQIQSLRLTDINALPKAQVQANLQTVVNGTQTNYETKHRMASGKIRDVEVQAGVIKQSDKGYVYAIIQDITQRKQLEFALRKSERLYRLFAQNMPDSSVVMFDTDMRHTLVEGKFLKRFGTIAETMLGKLPHEMDIAPDALAFIVPIYQRALSGESFSYERQTPDYAYEAHVSPIEDEDGQIVGGMILSHDITERKKAEVALRENEARYNSVVTSMGEGLVLQTRDGVIQMCNSAAEQILGLTAEQMMGRTSIDPRWRAIHEDSSPFTGETHPAMVSLQTGEPQDNIVMGVHKPDDSLVWISINSRPLFEPNESLPYAVVVTFADITERKRLEDELRMREQQLSLITNHLQDIVTYSDENDQIVYANPAALRVIGFKPTEIVGKHRHEFVHPDDWDGMVAVRQQAIDNSQPAFKVEGRVRNSDGGYIDIETVGALIYNDRQLHQGGVYITRDITERKRLENALRESEEKYRLITENTSDGISAFDAVTQSVIYTSPSYDKLLGLELGEIFTLPVTSYADFIHPEDREQVLTKIRDAITHKANNLITNYRSLPKRGQAFWREDHGKFTYASDGSLLRIDVVSRDITERKKMEALLAEQQKLQTILEKEQELSKFKTRMMQRIAHEFRTPLTTIQVSSETLIHYYERMTPEKRLDKGEVIKDQIRRITTMLDEISEVIQSTNADQQERLPTNLSELCREAASQLSSSLKLPDKFSLDLPDELWVQINPRTLKDGLSHVMLNAARYSEAADPVTVGISQTGDSIEIRIIDQGIGIPADELPRIFEPFFRGSNINERGGLGVGLTIARASIEAHGGTIRAESEVRKGTTFIIRLPV